MAHPEREGSAGAFECQPRHRSGPQQRAVGARPPPPQNGGEAAEDHGEQRAVAAAIATLAVPGFTGIAHAQLTLPEIKVQESQPISRATT